MPTTKRPTLYKMVDILYDYHFEKATNLYPKGTPTMIEGTIKKIACLASIEHCDRQILSLKENKRKSQYHAERFNDELVYWITVKEMIKNKMLF
jgi:hypothetical protein